MSGPIEGDAKPLPNEIVEHYLSILAEHITDPDSGRCSLCGSTRCEQRRWAWAQLLVSGQLPRDVEL